MKVLLHPLRKNEVFLLCLSFLLAQSYFPKNRLPSNRYLHGIPEDSRVRTDGRFLKEAAIVEETLKKVRALNDLAAQRGQTLAQMALSWILRDGDITSVLIGASKPSQILDNIGIVHATAFSEEERRRIEEILA